MLVGYPCEGRRRRACLDFIGRQISNDDSLDGLRAYAFALSQSGKATMVESGWGRDILVEDGREAGEFLASLHRLKPSYCF